MTTTTKNETKVKHTPAPWDYKKQTTSCGYVYKIGSFNACIYRDTGGVCNENVPHEEIESNARLIASAPALLEALKEIQEKASLYCDNASFAVSNQVACQSHLGHDMINYAHIADLATKAIKQAQAEGVQS